MIVAVRAPAARGVGVPGNAIARGQPAPAFAGTTLDGAALALADLRGRPVIVNFWGPSLRALPGRVPALPGQAGRARRPTGLAIVGVLMFDPPAPARDFVADFGATWPTVDDPDGAIRTAYRAVARPQTYFIDRDGILREHPGRRAHRRRVRAPLRVDQRAGAAARRP